ncbi:cytochrome P450 [Colletotrichum salicis]|uniref:Cytochrome P450 n=1 Tax=Colletotrichum salicis TaxID=1209931 RepID=A0A135VA21_9PEZI|nr:cytochrome P450 [Colletotrichum salicis]
MQTYVLLVVLALLIGAQLLAKIYRGFAGPLASVPGPFLARFTDLWYAWRIHQGRFEVDNIELHQKYGKFSINDPHAAKVIYGHGHAFAKSTWYDTWGDPNPHQWSLFSDRDEKRHSENRRLYQSMYSMSSLVNYESYVDECADLFSRRLSEMSDRGKAAQPVDMGHWFQCYAFDVVGRQFIVEFTRGCLADHQTKPKAVDAEDTSHLSEQSGTMDFLSKFLGKHSEDSSTFSQYHVLAGCVSNMVAGSDTTAISLSAILYQLLRNPKEMSKLQEEIDEFSSRRTGHPRRLNFQESLKLPYLQAVIKEALRLHPATGLPLERVVPEGGATIAGRFFPAGTIVGINTWVEHHHTTIFGEDAAAFKPDRWLTTDTDHLSAMNRHWMPVSPVKKKRRGDDVFWCRY